MSRQLNYFPEGGLAALRDDDADAFFKALDRGAAGNWDVSRGVMKEPLVFWAARAGAVECMKEWLERWGDGGLLGRDSWGRSAAHWAAAGREQEAGVTLGWLFQKGVAMDEEDASGVTPLGLALALGNQTMAIACAELELSDLARPCFRGLRPLELIVSLGFGASAESIARAGGLDLERLAGPRSAAPLEVARAATLHPQLVAMIEARGLEREVGKAGAGKKESDWGSL